MIRTTGTATERQLDSTACSVAGIAVLTITCWVPSAGALLNAVIAACSGETSSPVSRAPRSGSSTTATPCWADGPCSSVACGRGHQGHGQDQQGRATALRQPAQRRHRPHQRLPGAASQATGEPGPCTAAIRPTAAFAIAQARAAMAPQRIDVPSGDQMHTP